MPSSYVSIHVHIVFSTKDRMRVISGAQQPKLWAYMAGIATNHGMKALAIGGIEDHIHALVSLPATMSIAKGTQELKSNSSRWMNERRRTRFEWQEGYFACSVSRSQISRVMKYIANQREHHKKRSFDAEMERLLKLHGFEEVTSLRELTRELNVTRHSRGCYETLDRTTKSEKMRVRSPRSGCHISVA